MNPIVSSILWQSLFAFLFIGSVAGVAVGILLILRPAWLQSASQFANRWISTRHLDHALERSIKLDHWFYRYRRISGGLVLAGAAFILYFFTVQFDKAATITIGVKRWHLPAQLIESLVDALVLGNMIGALFAAFVSLFLLLRPSWLSDFEQSANQWVSSRRALKPMEMPRHGVDEAVIRHRQWAGALLILGSLYTVIMLIVWLS